ncbi:protease inhibitor I9 family protein [Plantactinospora sp. ZYX-F-223]|uniref:protease inhibitor I9 family protein n=1 Tax=Plantactinospora sp. ZYX-F-223 TaxID=3144103 RepID=UPI0031FD2844
MADSTSTSGSRRRRLAVPLLVLALASGGTAAPGVASAAPPGGTARSGADLGLAKDRDRPELTGGSGRRQFDAGRTRPRQPDAETRSAAPTAPGRYVVELTEEPVTAYSGGVSGLTRTRPAPGQRLAPDSTAARAYRKHLDARRDAVLAATGVTADRTFSTAFNGFSATLTPAQVTALRQDARVHAVTESRLVRTPPEARRRPAGRPPTRPEVLPRRHPAARRRPSPRPRPRPAQPARPRRAAPGRTGPDRAPGPGW